MLALVIALSTLTAEPPCEFEPFVAGFDSPFPLPGMRDGELIFEDAAICRAVPALLEGIHRQAIFELHRVQPVRQAHATGVGRGLAVPGETIDCRWRIKDGLAAPAFLGGDLLPSAWTADQEDVGEIAVSGLQLYGRRRVIEAHIGSQCWSRYRAALRRRLAPSGPTRHTGDPLLRAAAMTSDACVVDFEPIVRAVLARDFFDLGANWVEWAFIGECSIWALKADDRPGSGFNVVCPGRFNAIFAIRPDAAPAVVGANTPGMVGTLHPVDPRCSLDDHPVGP